MGTTRQHSASLVVCTDHEVAWDPFGGYQEGVLLGWHGVPRHIPLTCHQYSNSQRLVRGQAKTTRHHAKPRQVWTYLDLGLGLSNDSGRLAAGRSVSEFRHRLT